MPQLPKITEALLDQMMDAVFEPLVEAFPQITSGDFPPDAHFALQAALRAAAETWVAGNMPADRPLPFEHFQATGRDVADLSAEGVRDEPGPGRIYEGGCYIEERPPEGWPNGRPERWFLILGREDWLSDDLEELERHLYAYYLSECA